MASEYVDPEELAFLTVRDEVTNEELINRITGAPDMGGAVLMQLSAFVVARQEARVAGRQHAALAGGERPQPAE